jgi:hypothetical protein
MKKLFSFALVLALILSLSTVAFAGTHETDEFTAGNGTVTENGNVTANVNSGSGQTVYKVDIAWTKVAFTYNHGTAATWSPETHLYTNGTDAGWVGGTANSASGTITVTNHSNAVLNASVALQDGVQASQDGVQISLDTATKTLENAAEVAYNDKENAPSVTLSVAVEGVPNIATGTITWGCVVTITDPAVAGSN